MEYQFTDENFEKEVLEAQGKVVVDFYADWCGPCKMMGPIIHELAEEWEGKAKIGKLNVDQCPNISSKYQVMSIPTILIFENGQVKETFVGVTAKDVLEKKLTQE